MSAPTRGLSASKAAEPCTFVASRGKRKGEPCGVFTKKRCPEHGARCGTHTVNAKCSDIRVMLGATRSAFVPHEGTGHHGHCAECYAHILTASA